MKVLVTGGCGYVGSHTVRALASHGYTPIIYDNLAGGHREFAGEFHLIEGDIRDREKLRASLCGVEAVFHFAAHIEVAESVQDPAKYFDNNVAGSLALLEMAHGAGARYFIFSSSAAVYGVPGSSPIPEGAPTRPINPYGVSKLFIEDALVAFSRAYGLRHVSLRYFNAAGADESGTLVELHTPETHLIPSLLLTAAGLRKAAAIFGTDYPTPDGTCVRDFVHVSDLAEAHVLAFEYLRADGQSTALNIGTGEGHSVLDVVAVVESVTGRALGKQFFPRRPGDAPVLVADPSRARELLGWTASRSLQVIVSTAWKSFKNHRSLLGQQGQVQVVG
jgi:UDP-arabinose 4-epimerase